MMQSTGAAVVDRKAHFGVQCKNQAQSALAVTKLHFTEGISK